jgi:hypothetical protein
MGLVRLFNLSLFIFITYVFGILICKEYAEYRISQHAKPFPYEPIAVEAQNNASSIAAELKNRPDL